MKDFGNLKVGDLMEVPLPGDLVRVEGIAGQQGVSRVDGDTRTIWLEPQSPIPAKG